MTNPLQKLHDEAMLLSLSLGEKATMHAALAERMSTALEGPSAASPRLGTPSIYYYFFTPRFAMPFAALLIMLLGGGTAFAAKGALPGDPLYTIKTKVNEPLRGALAFSTEDKIQFHASVAETRLKEAEVLASENRLDAQAGAEIESSLEAHLAQGQELKAALDQKSPGAGSEASASFDSSIAAHGQVLAQLGAESSSFTTRDTSGTIAMRVQSSRYGARTVATLAVAKAATQSPTALSLAVSNQNASSSVEADTGTGKEPQPEAPQKEWQVADAKQVLRLAAEATSSLKQLHTLADTMRPTLGAEISARLAARFAEIDVLIASGSIALQAGDFDAAGEAFGEVQNRAITLSTFLAASQKFDHNILSGLLGDQ